MVLPRHVVLLQDLLPSLRRADAIRYPADVHKPICSCQRQSITALPVSDVPDNRPGFIPEFILQSVTGDALVC